MHMARGMVSLPRDKHVATPPNLSHQILLPYTVTLVKHIPGERPARPTAGARLPVRRPPPPPPPPPRCGSGSRRAGPPGPSPGLRLGQSTGAERPSEPARSTAPLGPLRRLSPSLTLRECRRHRLNSPHGAWVIDFLSTTRTMIVPQVLNHVSFTLVAAGPVAFHRTNGRAPTGGASSNSKGSHRLRHHRALLEETRK
jgi:hypothetical protein